MARTVKLYRDNYFKKMRRALTREEKIKIRKIEKLCLDLSVDYFAIQNRVYEILYGQLPVYLTVIKMAKPLHKLSIYLMGRAGEIRGVKFAK